MVKLKHKRASAHIVRYLEQEGQANIIQIKSHLDTIMKKHQPSIQRLGNILARGPEFNKVGMETVRAGPVGSIPPNIRVQTRKVTVWELTTGAEPWMPLRSADGRYRSPE